MTLPFGPSTVHAHESDELVDLAASFALEALDPDEQAGYVRHLGVCGVCRALASGYGDVADALPAALELREASAGLKERVLAPIRAQAGREASITRPWWGRTWVAPASLAAAAVFAVLLGAALAWNFSLRSRQDDQEQQLTMQGQILDAIAGGGRVRQLKGTKDAPGASGTVVQSPSGGRAFILVRDLPELPEGMQYQVWRIKGATPVGAGLFSYEGPDEQMVALAVDFSDADAIGISIEPKGGSASPTGAIVLLGT